MEHQDGKEAGAESHNDLTQQRRGVASREILRHSDHLKASLKCPTTRVHMSSETAWRVNGSYAAFTEA
jgi:hypothetical protein